MDKNMIATLSTTAISNNDQLVGVDFMPVLTISPAVLSFGVVSCGFYYNLKFNVKNHETVPIRIKIHCTPFQDEKNIIRVVNLPDIVAPGMETLITLELTAEFPGISMFNLKITQNYDNSIYSKYIEANIVTQETFKYVKKSLELQKRPIHRHNVITLSAVQGYMETSSINTPITSFSEALIMDDEDLDDLLSYPRAPNVYWDPFDKCLRIDPSLGSVIVEKEFGLEESLAKTEEFRRSRNKELEEQGFLTVGAFERIINDRINGSRPGSIQKQFQNTGEADFDGGESRTLDAEDGLASHASSHSRLLSVSSLLAMKRDRIEKQRRDTVNSANMFAQKSKKDSMVNSMRTLSMIQNRASTAASYGGGSVGGGSVGSSLGSKEA